MQMLAAFGGGSAVQGALNRGDIPPVDLGSAAASGAGVSASTGNGLNLGSGGGTIRPGGGGGGLGSIGSTKGDGNYGAGKETAVRGPTGDVSIAPTTATVAVANAVTWRRSRASERDSGPATTRPQLRPDDGGTRHDQRQDLPERRGLLGRPIREHRSVRRGRPVPPPQGPQRPVRRPRPQRLDDPDPHHLWARRQGNE